MFICIAGIGIETNATSIGILPFGILVRYRSISPEEHFQHSKTSRGSSLYLDLFIIVQLFEFYLVSQSLLAFSKKCIHIT